MAVLRHVPRDKNSAQIAERQENPVVEQSEVQMYTSEQSDKRRTNPRTHPLVDHAGTVVGV